VCNVGDQEPVVEVLGALETYAGAALGVLGGVVDAYEGGLRVLDVADETLFDGGSAVLILHEAFGGIGVGVEGEGGKEVFVGEVVGESICALGGVDDGGEGRHDGQHYDKTSCRVHICVWWYGVDVCFDLGSILQMGMRKHCGV
jgi:hypothetical protein